MRSCMPHRRYRRKNEISKLWAAIYDSTKKVAVQVAPAVRVGIGEEFGMSASQPVMGKIVTALKMLGADYVLIPR